MNKKVLLIIIGGVVLLGAAAAVVLILLLGGKEETGEEEQTDPVVPAPIMYEVEAETVTALPVGDTITVTMATDEESGSVTYRYAGLTEPAGRMGSYCELLTAEDFGFTPVDEERMETVLPDFTAEEGAVQLVRPMTGGENAEGAEDEENAEGEFLLSLSLTWSGEECTACVTRLEGGIAVPQPPEEEAEYTAMAAEGMTMLEAVDYLSSLEPASLGLTGESMEEYQVYVLDGTVFVQDSTCLRLNVYGESEKTKTNEIAGQYFLARDGMHLYRLDTDGAVRELNV